MTQQHVDAGPLQQQLDDWHRFVATRDASILDSLLAPGITFRSPFVFTPTIGFAGASLILRTVITVFEDFRYHRTFFSGTHDVTLEFSARVGEFQLKGVDLVHFNAAGQIDEFEVMIRPAKALQALGEAMGAKIGPELARMKAEFAGK